MSAVASLMRVCITPSQVIVCSLAASVMTKYPAAGDTLEVELPMLTVAEPLRDVRPWYARFRAIMRGPHLMAGLTHAGRTAVVEPIAIADAVTLPPADGCALPMLLWSPLAGVTQQHC